MTLIYIAGPLFNTHERWYLENIAAVLEKAGYQTFLPHRDAGLLGQITLERRNKVFDADLEALDRCDICVALLTGPDQDSGTSAEIGYSFAKGKPCYGISDDFRWMNNFIWGMCNNGENIAKSPEELVQKLELTGN
jgi:nucleoside 2-deoxyribosyltransferase